MRNILEEGRIREFVCFLLALPILSFSQEKSKTTAPCSPIAPYNKGIIEIQCKVDSGKTGDRLIEILNRIQENHLDLELVISKLYELQKGVNAIKEQVNPNTPKITYTKRGVKRIVSPARSVVSDEATSTYEELAELVKAHEWFLLSTKCEAQIRERPEWFTPYVFAALAYANLGNTSRAIELLEKADEGMGDAPDYEDLPKFAKELLRELKSQ